jgi:penicillin V acylase-like amidase (Ntn superfamily)
MRKSALFLILFAAFIATDGCSDFIMNFTDARIRLSARTMDLGSSRNWTLTSWPRGQITKIAPLDIFEQFLDPSFSEIDFKSASSLVWESKFGSLGISGNWLGDDKALLPSFFADSMNENGLSCAMQTLINSQYQQPRERSVNVFNAIFCKYVVQMFGDLDSLFSALPEISIYGPDALGQHYVLHDASGRSMVIELVDRNQIVYFEDGSDKVINFGIATNEPTLNWHYENINHYLWKRSLLRQAISVPGNFYPDERFLRIFMLKTGMKDGGMHHKLFRILEF